MAPRKKITSAKKAETATPQQPQQNSGPAMEPPGTQPSTETLRRQAQQRAATRTTSTSTNQQHSPAAELLEEEKGEEDDSSPEPPATKPTLATLRRHAEARANELQRQAQDLRQSIADGRARARVVPRGSDEFQHLVQLGWDLDDKLRVVQQEEAEAREKAEQARLAHRRELGRSRAQRFRDNVNKDETRSSRHRERDRIRKQGEKPAATTPGSIHPPPTPATMRPVSTTQAACRAADGPPLDGPLDNVEEEEDEEDEEEMLLRALPNASPNTRNNFSNYLRQEAEDDMQNTQAGNEELRETNQNLHETNQNLQQNSDQMVANRQGFLTRTASRRRMMVANLLASAQQNALRPTDLHEALDLASPSSSPLRSQSSPPFSERSQSESPPRSMNRLGAESARSIADDGDHGTADDVPPSNSFKENAEESEDEIDGVSAGKAGGDSDDDNDEERVQDEDNEEEDQDGRRGMIVQQAVPSSPRRTRRGTVLGGPTERPGGDYGGSRGHRKGGM